MELLSDAQRQELRSILLLGCDRTTARNFLGLAPAQLREALAGDDGLAELVVPWRRRRFGRSIADRGVM